MSKKNVLITGVTGYIGTNLVKAIHNEYNCFGVVRKTSNISEISNKCKIVYVDSLEDCFKNNKIDIVVHLATNYGRGGSQNFIEIINDNFNYGMQLVMLCKKYCIQRFFNADTCLEKDTNYYSMSKKQFLEWLILLEIPTTNMVFQHFYGPNNKNGDFISFIINALKTKNELDLTIGTQKRDFIYITDTIDAITMLLNHNFKENYQNVEIGSGTSISISYVVLELQKLLKTNNKLNFGVIPLRKNDEKEYVANPTFLNNIDWKQKISLTDGLKMCI
jgi:nucleoside-diphosphate-sugar epimerase